MPVEAPARKLRGLIMKETAATGRVYHALLGLLVVAFFLQPLWSFRILGAGLSQILVVVILVTALLAVSHSPLLMGTGILLVLSDLLLSQFPTLPPRLFVLGQITQVGVFLFVIGVFLSRILSHRTVTSGTVSGALCVFLLLGLMWGVIYVSVETVVPGSFNGLSLSAESPDRQGFFYFSFVTLTTLGYGDITPATTAARSMATLEAVVGQVFLVVLVARLVGLWAQSESGRSRPADDEGGRRGG